MRWRPIAVPHPHLVVVPNLLSIDEQRRLAHVDDLRLAEEGRWRRYDRLDAFQNLDPSVASRYMDHALARSPSLPLSHPTHVLANVYTTTDGLRWHRDIYDNDGDGRRSIINLSIGASAVFACRLDGRIRRFRMNSGDAIIFGGDCRYIEHAVEGIDLSQTPRWMSDAPRRRISYTFRDSPSMFGAEGRFQTFDVNCPEFCATQAAFEA